MESLDILIDLYLHLSDEDREVMLEQAMTLLGIEDAQKRLL